jgi:hypothetical protein
MDEFVLCNSVMLSLCDISFLGCLCSQCILWTLESRKLKCDASRNQEACCFCRVVPNTQNTLQNINQEVGMLLDYQLCLFFRTVCCLYSCLNVFISSTLAGSLVPIQFSRRYEMNQCMIQGKELRWHSVNRSTGRLSLAYLKVSPRLRRILSLCRFVENLQDLLILLSVPASACCLLICTLVSSVMRCCSVAR